MDPELAAWAKPAFVEAVEAGAVDGRVAADEDVAVEALPVEASTRRFFRLSMGASSCIAMHAPPQTEDNPRYLRLAQLFRGHGLATPRIHAADLQRGFVLMEDLGARDFQSAYRRREFDAPLSAAVEALVALQAVPADGIPPYTAQRFGDELGIFEHWLIERYLGLPPPGFFDDTRHALVAATGSVPRCVVHRDYHCRNLIWREDGQVGIVDFQDALVGPCCYDIASLLRDCYHAFPESTVAHWRQRFYQSAAPDCSQEAFNRAFDLTAVQRQLKAVGIFARLYLQRGRGSHLSDIVPVLQRLVAQARGHAETEQLAAWLQAQVLPAATRRIEQEQA